MRKYTLAPLLLSVVLSFLAPSAQAKSLTTEDYSQFSSWGSINTGGALVRMHVQAPAIGSVNLSYTQYLVSCTLQHCAYVGYDDNGQFCSGYGHYEWFYGVEYSGYDNIICTAQVDSRDYNYDVTIALHSAVIGGYWGVVFYIFSDHLNSTICWNTLCTVDNGYFQTNMDLTTYDQDYTRAGTIPNGATAVAEGGWYNNQYWNGSAWAFDGTTPSHNAELNGVSNNPPSEFWSPVPLGNTNNGGEWYTCDEGNNTNSC